MCLKPKEFYALSPKEFDLMVKAFRNKRIEEYKLNRNILFVMVRMWGGKDSPSKPEDLWDLGDKVEVNDDEISKLFEALKDGR